jgi:hypothetical protein
MTHTDRYVIVYRDGSCGPAFHNLLQSNSVLRAGRGEWEDEYRPAYRIRIREKAPPAPKFEFRPFHLSDPVPDSVMQAAAR